MCGSLARPHTHWIVPGRGCNVDRSVVGIDIGTQRILVLWARSERAETFGLWV